MISVMEGDSVTLNTDVTEIQQDDLILWSFRFNSSETRIAEIYKQIVSVYDNKENNERFRDRLKIDEQTGSLTITNINKLHSGLYKLKIISGQMKYFSFSIAVYGILPVPVIIRDASQHFSPESSGQNCSLLCSVVNVSAVTLSWYKGNSLLSSISVSDLSISLSLPLEVEYQENNIYSCVINNPITNQTQHNINITQLCQPDSESNQTTLLLVVLLLVLLLLVISAVVVMMMICRRRKYTRAKQEAQSNEEEVDYTEATFIKHEDQDTRANGHDQTVYSEVVLRR
ncbi:SLAM family member 9-like [Carassius gibelio]|uniref:SLAM family member 9-like n=1 Tax=Carassius gibelio TaxID=101364 RepID=UPI0022789880|nr:SLAM family member 9-like [Carassius gibelio]